MLLRDAKQCCSCLEYFFVREKHAIWCLKRKSLNINLLFIELLYKINITFVIVLIFEEKICMKCKYIHFLPPYLEFCDLS